MQYGAKLWTNIRRFGKASVFSCIWGSTSQIMLSPPGQKGAWGEWKC